MRSFALGLLLILPARMLATAAVYEPPAQREWRQQGEVLRNELRAMNARWAGGQLSSREVVLESERLRAGFNQLSADARDLIQADYALNRELASRRSAGWREPEPGFAPTQASPRRSCRRTGSSATSIRVGFPTQTARGSRTSMPPDGHGRLS